jgi:outer membrane protein
VIVASTVPDKIKNLISRRFLMKSRVALLMLICGFVLTAGASSTMAADWGVGGGVAVVPDYIGSSDYEVAPLPYFTVDFDNHMNVKVVGGRVQSNLVPHPIWKAGVVGQYIGKRDDDVDDKRVGRLDEVDASFMLGPWVGFNYPTQNYGEWHGRVETLWDIADGNDGQLTRVAGGWGTPFLQTMKIGLEGFMGFGDGDFMSSYFGVGGTESRKSGLDDYDADAGIYEVGLSANYAWAFTPAWRLHVIGGVSQLVGDADDDSPVVDQGSETQGMGGLMVTFHF